MEYEKKDNKGAAFINKNKNKPSQPDFIGNILVDGKEKRVAFWKNKSTDGSEYLTFVLSDPLSLEEKNNYRKADLPAQVPYKKPEEKNNTPLKNNSPQTTTNQNSSISKLKNENNDISDLEDILNFGDDEPPF